MRYPAAETAEKHARILEQAARLFRERGFSNVSVSEIMKATGLTHGAFYNHFESKDALIAESLEHAASKALADLAQAQQSPQTMAAYREYYLSTAHCDSPGDGCLMATLASEIGREPVARAGFTAYLKAMLAKSTAFLSSTSESSARRESIRTMSSMVGAVVLARAVDDPELAEEILREVRAGLK